MDTKSSKSALAVGLAILSCILSGAPNAVAANTRAASASDFAGDWTLSSTSLTVTVDSWGAHCGPKPQSYSSKSTQPIKIIAKGNHLVFSRGGVRTNRCFHTNPRLRVVDQNAQVGNWSIICRTDPTDPKAERGEYTLIADGPNRLDYAAKSKYDWSLKGDRCLVHTREKRVYQRHPQTLPPAAVGKVTNEPTPPKAADRCDPNTPLKRLSVTPADAQIGPGEFVCFKAMGVDTQGCRSQAEAEWTSFQGGLRVNGLMSDDGCFFAGETAADSEGTYAVLASVDGIQAQANVNVVFPDIDVLLSAQLWPLEANGPLESLHPNEADQLSQPAGEAVPNNSTLSFPASPIKRTIPIKKIVAASAIVLLLISAFIVIFMLASKGKQQTKRARTRSHSSRPPKNSHKKSDSPGNAADTGMVCPACHRGYKGDARFCPHDAKPLIPYSEWRTSGPPR